MKIDVEIQKIGNSRGIILPEQVAGLFNLGDRVTLKLDPKTPRQGWAEALAAAAPEALSGEEQAWLGFAE
ncbi:MAG: hypothetical protein RRB13_14050 [bacterium]|nr:hypothetical protein [bacterium]